MKKCCCGLSTTGICCLLLAAMVGCEPRSDQTPTPVQPSVTTPDDSGTPAEEPAADEPAEEPAGEQVTEEATAPSEEPAAPVAEPVTPADEPVAPAEESATAEEPVMPAEEPAEQPAPPAEEPTEDAAAPAEEAAAPAEEPAPAVEEPAMPAEKPATGETEAKMGIEKKPFGKTADSVEVDLYTCTNAKGVVLKMTNFGATVVALELPDRDGNMDNVNLGFSTLDGYLGDHPYFGATVGRYCNRIGKGKFTLDGKEYTLATNDGENHLHGGEVGFNKVVWNAEPFETEDGVGIIFSYRSKDGEEGYPGNVDVTAVYTLTNEDDLVIDFSATTDAPTPLNLTNHNYWNLCGAGSGTIRDHVLTINADKYLPTDAGLIPTGEMANVAGTPLDFTKPKKIGLDLDKIEADPVGFDHCWVLRPGEGGDYLTLAARVKCEKTGRVMEVHTTQPGLQFYSGNFLDGSEASGGYKQYEGFCLETQHYPDSPNHENFPSTILRPGETYKQTTVLMFSVE